MKKSEHVNSLRNTVCPVLRCNVFKYYDGEVLITNVNNNNFSVQSIITMLPPIDPLPNPPSQGVKTGVGQNQPSFWVNPL